MIHKRHLTSNYSCNPNEIFDDDAVSRKAKCLLLELLSKPENWNINFKHLVNSGKEGERAVRAGINELIEAGYIHREIPRDNGRLGKTEYHIFDRRITNEDFQTLIDAGQEDKPKVTPSPKVGRVVNPETPIDILPVDETAMRKTSICKTATIINTDNLTNTEGTTATAEAACTREAKPEAVAEPLPPSSYPATSEINSLLDLIPERFRQPMVDNVVMKALQSFTPDQVTDAVLYSVDNVKGGHMQFKAFLDKAIHGGWGIGYQQAKEKPVISVRHHDPFEMPRGRYPNGTVTGSKRMDSNILAGIDFLEKMGVMA